MSGKDKKKPSGTREVWSASGENLLWGINPVRESLITGSLSEIRIQRGKGGPRIQDLIELAREKDIRVRFVELGRLGVPSGCRHQGVVARRNETDLLSFAQLVAKLEETGDSRLLVLDSIQDPRNLGSIFRSALAAGFRHIIMTRERSAPVSGTVARASAGALAHLHLCRVINLAETLKELRNQGFWVYGAVADDDAVSLYDTDFSEKIALVVGSEGKGIRPLVKKNCDFLLTIPMRSSFDSLNVAVAAAIIMFEVVRSRQ